MLSFEFTQEQLAIKESVRDFAKKEITPYNRKMDDQGKLEPSILKELTDMGLMAIQKSALWILPLKASGVITGQRGQLKYRN